MDEFIAMFPPQYEMIDTGKRDGWGYRMYKTVEKHLAIDAAPFTEKLIGSGQEVGCSTKVDFFKELNIKWTPSMYDTKPLYFVVPTRQKTGIPATCRNYILPYAKGTFPKFRKVLYIQSSLADNCIKLLHDLEDYLGLKQSATLKLNDRAVLSYKIILNGEWIKSPMRYSFITYVLKCGLLYKGPDIKTFVDSKPTQEELALYPAGVSCYRSDGSWSDTQPRFQYILKEKKLDSLDAYDWKTWNLSYGGGWGFKDCLLKNGYFISPENMGTPIVPEIRAKIYPPTPTVSSAAKQQVLADYPPNNIVIGIAQAGITATEINQMVNILYNNGYV